MPPKSTSRLTWYTRDRIARLVIKLIVASGRAAQKYLCISPRFILVAVYTGTRCDRIQRASFVQEEGRAMARS